MNIPKRRNGFYYINDKEYPSVTKILGETLNKPALMYWAGKECTKIALKDPTLSDTEVMAEFRLISKKATTRGQQVHRIFERWCEDKKFPPIPEEYKLYGEGLKSWIDTHKPTPLNHELELHSDKYIYAGRCDLICTLNDETWLIDFKTGKNIYQEVGVQLAAYKQAIEEMDIVKIDKTGVVLLTHTGEFQFKETTDTIEDFENILKVWQWIQKK